MSLDLDDVAACLASASTPAVDPAMRVLYAARARATLDTVRERARELDVHLTQVERELARSATPTQTTLAMGGQHGPA